MMALPISMDLECGKLFMQIPHPTDLKTTNFDLCQWKGMFHITTILRTGNMGVQKNDKKNTSKESMVGALQMIYILHRQSFR